MGRDIVRDAIIKIKDFPDEFSNRIEHIILSCNISNKLQYQEQPSFPEALLIKQIILLDSKMNLMDAVLDKDQETGNFTNRHNYFKVPLYKKDESE